MNYQEHIKSWKCDACNPSGQSVPVCKTVECKRPLTKLGEPWNCWICLHCNEHPAKVNQRQALKEDRKKRRNEPIDVKPNQDVVSKMIAEAIGGLKESIREIVQDEIAVWTIPSTKPAQEDHWEPEETVEQVQNRVQENLKAQEEAKPETWLQKAKRLGVQTHHPDGGGMRKKVAILADIEAVEQKANETVSEELRTEEQG